MLTFKSLSKVSKVSNTYSHAYTSEPTTVRENLSYDFCDKWNIFHVFTTEISVGGKLFSYCKSWHFAQKMSCQGQCVKHYNLNFEKRQIIREKWWNCTHQDSPPNTIKQIHCSENCGYKLKAGLYQESKKTMHRVVKPLSNLGQGISNAGIRNKKILVLWKGDKDQSLLKSFTVYYWGKNSFS